MTRTRKLTLSMREFSHLVSESLDVAHVSPSPQSLVGNTAVFSEPSQKHHPRPSFHRIFSRPPATPRQHSPERSPEDHSETPRKMIGWPFSRSPRKNRPARDEDDATTEAKDIGTFPYSVTSVAATSTSSLGSLVPAHERLFQVVSHDSDEPTQDSHLFMESSSSRAIVPCAQPATGSSPYAHQASMDAIFGNKSATSISSNRSTVEPDSRISDATTTSFEDTEASCSVTNCSEPETVEEDPTPRASTFGPRAAFASADVRDDHLLAQRGRSQRLSLVVPSRNLDLLVLRPAVGALPHAPSETEFSTSVCSTSSPTSPAASDSFPAIRPSGSGTSSLRVPPTPPNPRIPAMFPDVPAPANLDSTPAFGYSPRQGKRAMSRSLTPPPLPRPPPTGPLPAVPSSVPPVPPIPPLLKKLSSMNMKSHLSSPPRPTLPGALTNPATALPPSPPGALRLPSRLSWVNSVRAVLPSPPASPTKSLKSLATKTQLTTPPPPPSSSTTKAEKKRSGELKRPTSIGVIEAADNNQVRRTKSILLLGSRSKSNASLGTKRVQIHADVNLDAGPSSSSRKQRRKSSAATVGHPILFSCSDSDPGLGITPMPSAEILVPRERRHSAPLLSSSSDPSMPGISADWTLSLPFCTDVPGNKILLSPLQTPLLKPELGVEDVRSGEDWTLCMPLKVRVDTPTAEEASEGCNDSAVVEVRPPDATQLPTPSPSPTCSTPSSVVSPLDSEESVPASLVERPVSPASLGPHVGGLDLSGGRGKRASGWHVYGWFDGVHVPEEEAESEGKGEGECRGEGVCECDGEIEDEVNGRLVTSDTAFSDSWRRLTKSHVAVFRRAHTHDANGRHPSQESVSSSVSTSETTFYSARSSLLVN